jgi:hypothetical protein
MGTARIILIAVMAGIYSGVLDDFEYRYELNQILSNGILVLLTFVTGYLLYKSAPKSKRD